MSGRARLYALRALLVIGAMVLTVAALEGLARWWGVRGVVVEPTAGNCLQRDPAVGTIFRPNCIGTLVGTPFRTNSLGLRGPEPRPGARRILAVGDSSTWGWKVADDQTYPARLQALLDEREAPHHWDVLNAGVPGWTSYQGLVFLRDRGLALHPEIVIVSFGFNDTSDLGDIEERLAHEREMQTLLKIDDFLLDHSSAYRFARWQSQKLTPAHRPLRVPPEKYRTNLTEIFRLIVDAGARPVLVKISHLPLGAYWESERRAREQYLVQGVLYQGPRIDVIHPTPEGDQQIAVQLADLLQQQGYLW